MRKKNLIKIYQINTICANDKLKHHDHIYVFLPSPFIYIYIYIYIHICMFGKICLQLNVQKGIIETYLYRLVMD